MGWKRRVAVTLAGNPLVYFAPSMHEATPFSFSIRVRLCHFFGSSLGREVGGEGILHFLAKKEGKGGG